MPRISWERTVYERTDAPFEHPERMRAQSKPLSPRVSCFGSSARRAGTGTQDGSVCGILGDDVIHEVLQCFLDGSRVQCGTHLHPERIALDLRAAAAAQKAPYLRIRPPHVFFIGKSARKSAVVTTVS